MKKLLIFIGFIISQNASAQLILQWQANFGGSAVESMTNSEIGTSNILKTNDGGFILAGNSFSNDGNATGHHGTTSRNDFWVVKLDSLRNIQWERSLGGTNEDQANKIIQTSDSGFILIGFSDSFDGDITSFHGSRDIWVVKLDFSGNIQWQKNYGGTYSEVGTDIIEITGGFIFCGTTGSNDGDVTNLHGNPPTSDFWVVKISIQGGILWQKTFGGSNLDYASSITKAANNTYIIGGTSNSNNGDVTGNHGNYDYWIIKIDSIGNLLWQKSFGGSSGEQLNAICNSLDGNHLISGYSASLNGDITGHHGNTANDYWVVKFNSSGNLIWQKSLGGTDDDVAYGLSSTNDNGTLVIGGSRSIDGNVYDHIDAGFPSENFWITKLDSAGNIDWSKSLAADSSGNAKGISGIQISTSCYVFAGNAGGVNFSQDYWIIKLCDNLTTVTGNNLINSINIYPNPTTDRIYFNYQSSELYLELSNISGTLLLSKKINTPFPEINLQNYSEGVYFLTIYSKEGVSRKIIVKQ